MDHVCWVSAFTGGTIGGVLIALFYGWQRNVLMTKVAVATEGLVAHHDEVVRGLIERIHQLEARP